MYLVSIVSELHDVYKKGSSKSILPTIKIKYINNDNTLQKSQILLKSRLAIALLKRLAIVYIALLKRLDIFYIYLPR